MQVTDPCPGERAELPEQMRVRREKLDRLRARASTPTRSASRARPPSPRSARNTPSLGPTPRPATGSASPAASCSTGSAASSASPRCATARGDLQVMLSLDKVGEESPGGLEARRRPRRPRRASSGEVITSRRGELSILADSWAITSKCLRPLPEKHVGLTDPEARVRQRYVDLIVNDEAREMARTRSATVRGGARLLARGGLPRGRDADAAADPRRRRGPAVHDPHQRLRHGALPAHRARALPQAAASSAASRRSSRSTATSATRARTPRTTPSSRCSRPTARTSTTTTWPT